MAVSQKMNKEASRVVNLSKVNSITQIPKRKSSTKIWVKKLSPKKDKKKQTFKIYTNPIDKTMTEGLNKLKEYLDNHFSCVSEDLKKKSVANVLKALKAKKTITVSIGDCSYIFDGDKMESNGKFKDPRIQEILSTMVKSLRDL